MTFIREWKYIWRRKVEGTRIEDTSLDNFMEHSVFHNLEDLYYGVKDTLFPHNSLKVRTLTKHYCDPRELLLHSSFQVLVDFVEEEKPFEWIDWSSDIDHEWAGKEMEELYHWWTRVYPERVEAYELDFGGRRYVEDEAENLYQAGQYLELFSLGYSHTKEYRDHIKMWGEEEVRQFEEDQRMLQRLVTIRAFLWT